MPDPDPIFIRRAKARRLLGVSERTLRDMEDQNLLARVYPAGTDRRGRPVGHPYYRTAQVKQIAVQVAT